MTNTTDHDKITDEVHDAYDLGYRRGFAAAMTEIEDAYEDGYDDGLHAAEEDCDVCGVGDWQSVDASDEAKETPTASPAQQFGATKWDKPDVELAVAPPASEILAATKAEIAEFGAPCYQWSYAIIDAFDGTEHVYDILREFCGLVSYADIETTRAWTTGDQHRLSSFGKRLAEFLDRYAQDLDQKILLDLRAIETLLYWAVKMNPAFTTSDRTMLRSFAARIRRELTA
jgi:hypothetical protein